MRKIAIRLLACLLLAPLSVLAVPISYFYSGVGVGSLGGNAFATAFRIEAKADTANVGPWAYATEQNTHLSTTIWLDGVGTFEFTEPTHTWVAAGYGGGIGKNLAANLLTLLDFGMGSYDLVSDFSLSGTGTTQGQFVNIATTGGALTVASLRGDALTFEARLGHGDAVPEPVSLALVGIGLVGLGVSRRRQVRN